MPTNFQIGINLEGLADYSKAIPFVDAFKTSRRWIAGNNSTFDLNIPTSLDSSGHAIAIPAGAQHIKTLMFWDLNFSYSEGQYLVLYDGSANITYSNNVTKNVGASVQGREVVTVSSAVDGVVLQINRIGASTVADEVISIRNIRFIPIAKEFTYQSDPFNPEYLAKLSSFHTLRFMDWLGTNNSSQVNWVDRPEITDAKWLPSPVELCVDLCNKLNKDGWFCIPHQATDDYIQQFAITVRNRLNPGLKVIVEYSNEVWNFQFAQAQYAIVQSATLWGVGVGNGYVQWMGKRTVEVRRIWRSIWGSQAHRVKVVLCNQAGYLGLEDGALNAPNWVASGIGNPVAPKTEIDAYGIAPYFDGSMFSGDATTTALIAGWATEGETGFQKAFAQLRSNTHFTGNSFEKIKEWVVYHKNVASLINKEMLLYECGQHLIEPFNGTQQQKNTVVTFFLAMNRRAEMGQLYIDYLTYMRNSAIGISCIFSDISSYSKFGSWGIWESVKQLDAVAPKATAVKQAITTLTSNTMTVTITGTPKSLSDRSFQFSNSLFNGVACFYWGGSNTNILTGRQGTLFDDDGGAYSYEPSTINNMIAGKSLKGAANRNGVHLEVPTNTLTNDLPGIYDDFTVLYYGKILSQGSIFTVRNSTLEQFISVNTFVDSASVDGTLANMVFTVKGATATVEKYSSNAVKGVQKMYAFRKQGNQLGISIDGIHEAFSTLAATGSVLCDGQAFIGRRDLNYYSNQISQPDISLFVVYKRSLTDAEIITLRNNPFTILPDPSGVVLPPPPDGYTKRAKVFYLGNSVTDTLRYPEFSTILNTNKILHTYGRQIIPGAPLDWLRDHPIDGFIETAFGYPQNALVNFDWDFISFQPFDRNVIDDVTAITYFLNLLHTRIANLTTRVLIYSRWHRQTDEAAPYNIAAFWNEAYNGSNFECKAFFVALIQAVRIAFPSKVVNMVPVGDALLLLDTEAKAGRVPGIATAKDLFADGIHFTNVGSYLVGCVFYATIYKEDPKDLGFVGYTGVNQALADKIQAIAWSTVDKHPFSGVDSSVITPPDPPPVIVPPPIPNPNPGVGIGAIVNKSPGSKLIENPGGLSSYL
jgi:hypothetical protein